MIALNSKRIFTNAKPKYAFFLIGLTLPMSVFFIRYGLNFSIAWLILCVVLNRERVEYRQDKTIIFLLIAFFLTYALSILTHPPFHFNQLEKRIPLIALPLALLLCRVRIDDESRMMAMKGFIIGNFVVALFNLSKATYHSTRYENGHLHFDSTIWGNIPVWESIDHVGNYFFSAKLTGFIHPSYWALFLIMAIIFIWLHNPLKSKPGYQILSILFFLILIFLCSARASMIAAFVTTVIMVFIGINKFQSPRARLVLGIAIIGTIILMATNPRITGSIQSLKDESFKGTLRINAWKSAVAVIHKQDLILGAGVHRAEEEMGKEYKERGLEEHYNLKLNAHNQFLETMLGTGLLGLLMLLLIFIVSAKAAVARKDMLGILLIGNLVFHFCFESMLNRFHGIVFFTFFLLVFFNTENNTQVTRR